MQRIRPGHPGCALLCAVWLSLPWAACRFDESGVAPDNNNNTGNDNNNNIVVNPNCGDAVLQPGEECDDGNTAGGDGCSPSCLVEQGWLCDSTSLPSLCGTDCGDGLYIPGYEDCDDGNNSPNDGCDPNCFLEDGYTCTGSPSVCTAVCGDGIVAYGVEGCDDGNTNAGDGCDGICKVELGWVCTGQPSVCSETCGDGNLDTALGEACDDGNNVDCDGCAADCSRVQTCGDGFTECGEVCDDGNNASCDGCAGNCGRVDADCGDGIPECGEACDDGNNVNCDGCAGNCLRADDLCGDSIAECGETCDDGNTTACDGCSSSCQVELLCGNNVVDCNEECDGGDLNGADCASATGGTLTNGTLGCTASCTFDTSLCEAGCVNHVDCPLGSQCDGSGNCVSVGDDCGDNPTLLSASGVFNHTLENLNNTYNAGSAVGGLNCTGLGLNTTGGADRVYRIELSAGDYFSAWVYPIGFNPVLYLASACPVTSCMMWRNHATDFNDDAPERLDYVATTSETLYLIVDGDDGDGPYTLDFFRGGPSSLHTASSSSPVIWSEIMRDPAGGSTFDDACEWFEVHNPDSANAVDLQNVEFVSPGGNTVTVNQPLVARPEEYLVFAPSADYFANCNLGPVSMPYGGSGFNLCLVGTCQLDINDTSGNLIDQLDYAPSWPNDEAQSMYLCTNHLTTSGNDSSNNWQSTPATGPYEYIAGPLTNYGTPAAANPGPCN